MNFCTQSDMKEVNKNWEGCNVLVTGGASFTGSYLVDALVKRGASTWVIDNLTNGKLENIQGHVDAGRIEFHERDMRELSLARRMMVVYSLSASVNQALRVWNPCAYDARKQIGGRLLKRRRFQVALYS